MKNLGFGCLGEALGAIRVASGGPWPTRRGKAGPFGPSWVPLGSLLGAILTTLRQKSEFFSDFCGIIFRARILRGFGHHFRWPNLEKS